MNELRQKLITGGTELFDETPVLFAYLYGSVAKNMASPFSDLDVAIFEEELDRKQSLKLELTLSLALDELLGHAIESEVRIINYLPLPVQGGIITTGILIYCRDDIKRVEFETNLRMAYFDFLPTIHRYRRERLGTLSVDS